MIENGNMLISSHVNEEIPIYDLLLEFINYPLRSLDMTRNTENMLLREKCFYELIFEFLNFPIAELLINFARDTRIDAVSIIGRHEYLEKTLSNYNDIEIESVKIEPLPEAQQKDLKLNNLIELQKEMIDLTEACFIEKKFDKNFGGIEIDVKYKIFFSAKYGEFGESFEINEIDTFCLFAIVQLLKSGVTINKCANCGDYFVPLTRSNEVYCNNIFSNGRNCKQIGYENKINNDDVFKEYRKAYKNKNAYKQRTKNHNQNAEKEFKQWVYAAKLKLGECQDKIITLDEFKEWLKNN